MKKQIVALAFVSSIFVLVSQNMYAGKEQGLDLRMRRQQQKHEEHLRRLQQKKGFIFHRSNNNSPHFGSSDTVRATLFTLVLLSAFLPTTLAASCEPPKGSYTQTCQVTSHNSYRSTDPNLKAFPFCQFDISCEKLGGKNRQSQNILLPESALGCLKYYENCDGRLVMRSGEERLCKTEEEIAEQMRRLDREL
jgi:hypothetical protein